MRLLANGRPLAATTSGALGRFVLDVRAPRRSGRYRLVLRAGERRVVLPDLTVRPVVLAAVGDVNLGDRIDAGIRTLGPDQPWKPATPLLRAADIAVANLECAVSTRGWAVAGKEYTFRGAPSSLAAVARAGLDAVTVANNHSLDFGVEAFVDTLRHAHRYGLRTLGGGTLGVARTPSFMEAGGSGSRCSRTPTSGPSVSTPRRLTRERRRRIPPRSRSTWLPPGAAPTRSSSTSTGATSWSSRPTSGSARSRRSRSRPARRSCSARIRTSCSR